MNQRSKKRQILVAHKAAKIRAAARACVMITAAMGSAQLMHMISQPVPKYPPGSAGGFHPGGQVPGHWDGTQMILPDGSAWPPGRPDPFERLIRDRLQHVAIPPPGMQQLQKKLAILHQLMQTTTNVTGALERAANASKWHRQQLARIREKQVQGHHRTVRKNQKYFSGVDFTVTTVTKNQKT
jgi:hypothetical protein